MTDPKSDRLFAVVGRELTTVFRTRAFLVLTAGFALVLAGLAWTANPGGYVPLVLDLLAPMQVLVPALALAFGYRAVLGDDERGELDILRTYPISRPTFVLGVYLGRATALLVAVLGPLLAVALVVPASGGTESSFLATHAGMDSPVFYLRFVALTAAFALVVAAVAVAISATAGTTRGGIALAMAFGVALVLGLDAGVVAGLAGGVVPDGALQSLLALSPTSAFRGLVLETVIGVETGVPVASPLASIAGLGAWLVAALAVAVLAVWPGAEPW